jgi:hypothetical protein
MDTVFYHSGSFGDMIYSLPTVKRMGGGIFVSDLPLWHTRNIQSLLEFQPYITEVFHRTQRSLPPDFINLSKFRQMPDVLKRHLVNVHADGQGIGLGCWQGTPWLQVPDLSQYNSPDQNEFLSHQAYAVIHITPRYRTRFFNWTREVNWLFRQVPHVFFIGYEEEYKACGMDKYRGGMFGENRVIRFNTTSLLQAAAIVKQAALFSGNQSSMLAIRQGLGLPYRFEQAPHHSNCCQYIPQETILNPISWRAHFLYVSARTALCGQKMDK